MAALRAFVLTPSRSATISNPKRFQGSKINVPVSAKNALGSNSENSNSSPSEEKRVDKSFKKSSQSSWDAKNSEGKDYLYRLGQEADNVNVTVGARKGLVDDLFVGKFLGKDADIVFDYRQKVTRSFEHLQGDYYIAPAFMEKIVLHIVKNYMAHLMDISIPLILGVWGGKGQGKSFQTELIFRAMGIEPVIMSAGELESERAGEPGKLIRERYRTASQVIKNQGKMSCLMINDLDAGVGRFANTQVTVNNQIVMGTLMNLADNPTRVSIGQDWRESDITNRVPIIVTGNDFSTLYAPLIRDGRMEKFYWQPTREDLINIVHRMYQNDGILKDEVARIVDSFPNQALDFYGALRSRTYDRIVLKWVEDIGGAEKLGEKLLRRHKDDDLPPFIPPKQTIENLMEAGQSLIEEQQMGKMSCLMINDLDAGVGRFANTQVTVNNQIVMGTLMNLADNPTRVSIGQDWRESDITNRVPIIVTGNDFSTLYAPLIRDGRMEKFYWQPTREDLINIVHRMYQNDGILKDEVARIVDSFPNQALDFYGALRSRTYDRIVLKWVEDIGGAEKLGEKLLRRHKDDDLPPFIPPKQTIENLMEAGQSLIEEQQMVMKMRLSEDYMKNSKT